MDPLREGTGVGEEGRGDSWKTRDITTVFQTCIFTCFGKYLTVPQEQYSSYLFVHPNVIPSLVQKGAVCQ